MVCNFVRPSEFVSTFSIFLEEEFVDWAANTPLNVGEYHVSDGRLCLNAASRLKVEEIWPPFLGPMGYAHDIKHKLCSWCRRGRPEVHLRKCAGCLCIRYCSKECQKLDWKEHKVTCQVVAGYEGFEFGEWLDLVHTNVDAYMLFRDLLDD
eukprot:jgi/Mesvir1/16612/Mv10146-RA.1